MTATTITKRDLHEGWLLNCVGGPHIPVDIAAATVPATVPGSVHTDLLTAGLIPDPYLDMNEKALEWAWRADWLYSSNFAATPATDGERVDLVFDGLDTVATVTLNGTEVGKTFNQHRSYRFDVRDLIAAGDNALQVRFDSALTYGDKVEQSLGRREHVYPHPFNMVRKMACSFGWDWGPDLQTAGMWKGVRLERWRVARLAAVRPLVTVDGDQGIVNVHVDVERASEDELTVVAQVAGKEATATIAPGSTSGIATVTVDNPELWWPVGYGEAKLYDLTVELHSSDEHLDTYAKRIGFKTIEVDMAKDDIGAGFTYVLNGVRIFVKGANWIPDDHLMTRITRERLERRVTQAVDANMNLLRIWGGGIYETEDFYDVCDEMGVMVWQDFLFACASYPEESPVLEEVIAEARENVTRLSSHASLVMYNGSNENIWGFCDWGWEAQLEGKTWGLGYYEDILPKIVAELDPTTPYTPSSPFSPHASFTEIHPNNPNNGTVHEWEVWNRQDYRNYRNEVPRFCSEFGFQGPAAWSTIERSLPKEAFDQEHPAWLLHQKAEDGNDKLNRGFEPRLPHTDNFEMWHWTTQLNQARAIQYGIEHYRSHWPVCAGAIVWQLNDCWPVTSWAAVDGDERKKPLWYGLQKAYAPRLLTFQPRGEDGKNDPHGTVALVAVNDTDEQWNETLTFTRMSLDGTELAVATAHLLVEPRGTVTLDVPAHVREAAAPESEILIADAGYAGDDDHVRGLHTFMEDKDIAYESAPYTATAAKSADGYTVTVEAHGFVRNLTVLADKVSPAAEADKALENLVADDVVTFTIACAEDVEPDSFLASSVLVSVNMLVASE